MQMCVKMRAMVDTITVAVMSHCKALNMFTMSQAFESELKKYMAVEQEITQVAPLHNIGSLALETQPLKYSLKSEAASWKAQYAKNLHKQGSEDLKGFDQYMRDTTLKLNRKVEDLEDVRFIMGVLKEVGENLCGVRFLCSLLSGAHFVS